MRLPGALVASKLRFAHRATCPRTKAPAHFGSSAESAFALRWVLVHSATVAFVYLTFLIGLDDCSFDSVSPAFRVLFSRLRIYKHFAGAVCAGFRSARFAYARRSAPLPLLHHSCLFAYRCLVYTTTACFPLHCAALPRTTSANCFPVCERSHTRLLVVLHCLFGCYPLSDLHTRCGYRLLFGHWLFARVTADVRVPASLPLRFVCATISCLLFYQIQFSVIRFVWFVALLRSGFSRSFSSPRVFVSVRSFFRYCAVCIGVFAAAFTRVAPRFPCCYDLDLRTLDLRLLPHCRITFLPWFWNVLHR